MVMTSRLVGCFSNFFFISMRLPQRRPHGFGGTGVDAKRDDGWGVGCYIWAYVVDIDNVEREAEGDAVDGGEVDDEDDGKVLFLPHFSSDCRWREVFGVNFAIVVYCIR